MIKREYIKKILKEYVKEKKTFNIILEQSTTSIPSDVKGTLEACIPCGGRLKNSTVISMQNKAKKPGRDFAIKQIGTVDSTITRYFYIDGTVTEKKDNVITVSVDDDGPVTWDYKACLELADEEAPPVEIKPQDDKVSTLVPDGNKDKLQDMSQKTAEETNADLEKFENDYSRNGCANLINAFYRASELYEKGAGIVLDKNKIMERGKKIKVCKAKYENDWRRLTGNMLDKKLDALSGYGVDGVNARFRKSSTNSPYNIKYIKN